MQDDETRSIDEENLRVWEAAHEDPEGSLSAAQKVQGRAEAISYPRGRAEALRTQAYTHAVMNDLETGLAGAHEALDVLNEAGVDEPDVAATVHDSLANFYFFPGMYAQSFDHSNTGIEYARQARATRVGAYCLRNLAEIYSKQHEFERAGELYRESRRLFESIDYRIGVAWTLYGVGEIEFEEGRLEGSLDHFQRVLEAVTEQEFGMLYANARNGVARTLRRLGRLEEALWWIDQAMSAPRQYARIRAETLLIHAHTRAAAGEEERALEIFRDAADVASTTDIPMSRSRHGRSALGASQREATTTPPIRSRRGRPESAARSAPRTGRRNAPVHGRCPEHLRTVQLPITPWSLQ
ncbi:MAG: tetratricopeptide repeat protein [Spirochaetaceae bacterium]